MLHRRSLVSRSLALLILALYSLGLYLVFAHFLNDSSHQSLLDLGQLVGNTSSRNSARLGTTTQTILVSNDGGKTWTTASNQTNKYIFTLNCPAEATCYALNTTIFDNSTAANSNKITILKSTDGAKSWTTTSVNNGPPPTKPATASSGQAATPTPNDSLDDQTDDEEYAAQVINLVCPSPTHCYALQSFGLSSGPSLIATSNAGQTWAALNATPPIGFVSALSCPTETICYVIGRDPSVARTGDGGQTWQLQKTGATTNLVSISCSGPTDCMVLDRDGAIYTTQDSGQTWHTGGKVGFKVPSHLVCPSPNLCFALGYTSTGSQQLAVSRDGGDNWKAVNYGSKSPIVSLICPSTSLCLAALSKGTVISSSDGGQTWQSSSVAGGSNGVLTLTCPTSTRCYLLGAPDFK